MSGRRWAGGRLDEPAPEGSAGTAQRARLGQPRPDRPRARRCRASPSSSRSSGSSDGRGALDTAAREPHPGQRCAVARGGARRTHGARPPGRQRRQRCRRPDGAAWSATCRAPSGGSGSFGSIPSRATPAATRALRSPSSTAVATASSISSLHARAGHAVYAKAITEGRLRGGALRRGVRGPSPGARQAAARDGWSRQRLDGGVGLTMFGVGSGCVSRAVTTVRQAPRMPPVPPAPDPMIRTRNRRRIRPLEQIPVWHGFEPTPDGGASRRGRRFRRHRRADAAPGWAERGATPRGDAWRRAAARRRGCGHRQDAGHHPPDRVADRDPPRQAVRDPRADVHGQGRGGDAAPRRPARPVRLRGHGRSPRSTRSAIG